MRSAIKFAEHAVSDANHLRPNKIRQRLTEETLRFPRIKVNPRQN